MMETGKKLNFYRLGLKEGKTRRMELTESYRLTRAGKRRVPLPGSSL